MSIKELRGFAVSPAGAAPEGAQTPLRKDYCRRQKSLLVQCSRIENQNFLAGYQKRLRKKWWAIDREKVDTNKSLTETSLHSALRLCPSITVTSCQLLTAY